MARPRKVAVPEEPAPPLLTPADTLTPDGDAPVRRRRRRRTAAAPPDYAQETTLLVEAALKSRGIRGATQDSLQSVVTWARGVRTEGDELRTLASRPRRQKTQASTDRVTRYEMNRALLEGILAGEIALDVQEDGILLFKSGGLHEDIFASPAPVEALGVSGEGV